MKERKKKLQEDSLMKQILLQIKIIDNSLQHYSSEAAIERYDSHHTGSLR